ncbi:HlyD family secretion protein [Thermovibrio sp.]
MRAVKLLGAAVLIGITAWVGYFIYQHKRFVITDNAFQMAEIVNVSTQNVSGKIVKLYKKEFSEVKKGEPLFKVDDRLYEREVEALKGKLTALKERRGKLEVQLERLRKELPAKVLEAKEEYGGIEAQVEAAEKELLKAQVDYGASVKRAQARLKAAKAKLKAAKEDYARLRNRFLRYRELYKRRVISLEQFEEVKSQYYLGLARLKEARSALTAAEEGVKEAKSLKFQVEALKEKVKGLRRKEGAVKERVKEAEAQLKLLKEIEKGIKEVEGEIKSTKAQLKRAELLVKECLVRSPVSGFVGKKWKEEGDFVSPGLPVYSIYDPKTFFVLGWIDEDKVRFIKVGSPAKAELETCKETFKGKVVAVGKAAGSVFALIPRDTSSGEYTRVVQRVPVKVKLNGVPLRCIRPGTNVNLYIKKE